MSYEEKMVSDRIRARGFPVVEKKGYPDFPLVRGGEIVGFIEAKPNGGEHLKPEQARFERLCKRHRIPFLTYSLGMGEKVLDDFISSLE